MRKLMNISNEEICLHDPQIDTLDVVETESVIQEINKTEDSFDNATDVIESSEDLLDGMTDEIHENEIVLQCDDDVVLDKRSRISNEMLNFYSRRLGLPINSFESYGNSKDKLIASNEGIGNIFNAVVDGIKKLTIKIIASIKSMIAKMAVWLNQSGKKAVGLQEKFRNFKVKNGASVSDSDRDEIANKLTYFFAKEEKNPLTTATDFLLDIKESNIKSNKFLHAYFDVYKEICEQIVTSNDKVKIDVLPIVKKALNEKIVKASKILEDNRTKFDLNGYKNENGVGITDKHKYNISKVVRCDNDTIGCLMLLSEKVSKTVSFGASMTFPNPKYVKLRADNNTITIAKKNVPKEANISDIEKALENIVKASNMFNGVAKDITKTCEDFSKFIEHELKSIELKVDNKLKGTDDKTDDLGFFKSLIAKVSRTTMSSMSSVSFNSIFGYIRIMQNVLYICGIYSEQKE